MLISPDLVPAAVPEDFYAALWIGALLLAGNAAIDAFPAELDDLATLAVRLNTAGRR